MKNKFKIFFFLFLLSSGNILFAENILIESRNIILDKNKNTSIFENDVIIKTENNYIFKSDYAEYNKSNKIILLKDNIRAFDNKNNLVESNYAEYNEVSKELKSKGITKITTNENFVIESEDVILNDKTKIIKSDNKTFITDPDNNKIYLENFEYISSKNILKSIGNIKFTDINQNSYEFSQIYIDTFKKEILGTDIKAFMNDKSFKINKDNKPRIFANTVKVDKNISSFEKSIFTLCDYRDNDKCPPWTIQSSKMMHDSQKKTIFYDNALLKVYNIPIFYFPKLSHPDPTVKRRSGFLPPTLSDTKNLGSSISIPYFWALNDDKNLTISNRLFVNENPLFLGEYHQAFKNSNLKADFGYTEGYKNISSTKNPGDKSHFFTNFTKNFDEIFNGQSTLNLNIQEVSDNKYLKLYQIDSNLVDYNVNELENSIYYTYLNDDLLFTFDSIIFEDLQDTYNDKYEYILPEITFNKNLVSNDKFGLVDLQTSYKVHSYDTNKLTNFLINDFSWESNKFFTKLGTTNQILASFKNLNYETKNIENYKKDTTSEFHGALGYFSEINLKKRLNTATHLLKPKMLIRYSPGSMRKENDGSRLNPSIAFDMNKLSNNKNFEKGLNASLGVDYKLRNNDKELDFSIAQIVNQKENKKMPSKTSLDEKLSDLVGSTNYKLSDKTNFNYNFSIDQNYNQFNYNEIGTTVNVNPFNINFNYLQENEHIGDQKYFNTKIDYLRNDSGKLTFETKRNLVTDSFEFYNLSYEYINDCLRAGLVYRREFYEDSELEPENSLMFNITLTQFGKINSPSFNR